ncbi:hypothetical protein [Brevundimonas aurifodinae]|uniref:Secreted protein n=1 Tax=Brevundimonas aurifodinae TaxID=1508312 RepID=A0ABV1NRG8_9CAUL
MTRTITVFLVAGLAVSAAACTESKRARNAATFGDQPADITCWTYGTETFSGRSTGKVEYNDGGRIAFVDADNGRYTTIDGECRVVYRTEDEPESAQPDGPVLPPPAVPEA